MLSVGIGCFLKKYIRIRREADNSLVFTILLDTYIKSVFSLFTSSISSHQISTLATYNLVANNFYMEKVEHIPIAFLFVFMQKLTLDSDSTSLKCHKKTLRIFLR